jgi:hypothetical protein
VGTSLDLEQHPVVAAGLWSAQFVATCLPCVISAAGRSRFAVSFTR